MLTKIEIGVSHFLNIKVPRTISCPIESEIRTYIDKVSINLGGLPSSGCPIA